MSERYEASRSTFLKSAAFGFGAVALGDAFPLAAVAATMPASAHEALERLMAGNARFANDHSTCGPFVTRRKALVGTQSPFAAVLGCADSRASLATVFDTMPGDVFGVRVAGNFVDDNVLGSLEYSVAVLKTPLIMVLGHTNCGAVSAAVAYAKDGTTVPGHIAGIVEAIAPAAKSSRAEPGDWKHNATLRNVGDNVAALSARSTILADAVHAKKLAVVGGMYDLPTGRVRLVSA